MSDPVSGELGLLLAAAASLGVLHTLLGPDHYLPFIALARARRWSARRTAALTLACGAGHVLASLGLAAAAIALGWGLGAVEGFDAVRGGLAGWLLLGFGLAYLAWGLRRAWKRRPHTHRHVHADGTEHVHRHDHRGAHAHIHESAAREGGLRGGLPAATPWVLFVILVFGPCEPLIPLLMAPAAAGSVGGVALLALVFGLCTLATMLAAVLAGYFGLSRLAFGRLERYGDALAGAALAACGAAIHFGL